MEIGKKLRRLRVQRDLTLEDLAVRCDLSKGYLSQLERDLTSPSIATLKDILDTLGTDLRAFFNESQTERVVFTPGDMFESTEEPGGANILWLVPNAQKNAMEPILVTLPPGGQTAPDSPHEAEEFGYVLGETYR